MDKIIIQVMHLSCHISLNQKAFNISQAHDLENLFEPPQSHQKVSFERIQGCSEAPKVLKK